MFISTIPLMPWITSYYYVLFHTNKENYDIKKIFVTYLLPSGTVINYGKKSFLNGMYGQP